MPTKIDLTGKKFGRLEVKKEVGKDSWGQIVWECKCSCGSQKTVLATGGNLRRGNTKSCGCLDLERASDRIKKQTVNHTNPNYIKSKKLSIKNTSGVRGVCPTQTGKWRATIGYKGKSFYLGEFFCINDAIKARKKAEEKYYKPFLKEMEEELKIRKESDEKLVIYI